MEWPIGIEKLNRFQTGRLAVHSPTDKEAVDSLVEHAAKTDRVIFHSWPEDAPIPGGSIGIPQSVGHWAALHGKIVE